MSYSSLLHGVVVRRLWCAPRMPLTWGTRTAAAAMDTQGMGQFYAPRACLARQRAISDQHRAYLARLVPFRSPRKHRALRAEAAQLPQPRAPHRAQTAQPVNFRRWRELSALTVRPARTLPSHWAFRMIAQTAREGQLPRWSPQHRMEHVKVARRVRLHQCVGRGARIA